MMAHCSATCIGWYRVLTRQYAPMATRWVSRARIMSRFSGEPKYDSVRPWRSGTCMEWKPARSASTHSSTKACSVAAALRRSGRGWS